MLIEGTHARRGPICSTAPRFITLDQDAVDFGAGLAVEVMQICKT